MNKKYRVLFLFIFILLPFFLLSQTIDKLPKKSRAWIEEDVAYVISPAEKNAFLSLGNEERRESFIEEFWRQRDPNSETRNNEFRLEHYRRIAFADDKFGRNRGSRGSRTDRGKFYIILGKPHNVSGFDEAGVYPFEIWTYEVRYFGLPNSFRLIFFQPGGSGDFRLYDPLSDSPRNLIAGGAAPSLSRDASSEKMEELNKTNLEKEDMDAWLFLERKFGPEAAEAFLTLTPSEIGPESRRNSHALLEAIVSFPLKKVDSNYISEFLENQSNLDLNYSLHPMEVASDISVLRDPEGIFFIHYALSPENISLDLFRGEYFTNLRTTILLTDADGKTAYQGERNNLVELIGDELYLLKGSRFVLADALPAIPGRYTLNLLFENQASREYAAFEKTVYVPESQSPWMTPLILAKKVWASPSKKQNGLAYQTGNIRIFPAMENAFFSKDSFNVLFQLFGFEKNKLGKYKVEFSILRDKEKISDIEKRLDEYSDQSTILQEFSLGNLPEGKYEVTATLNDENGSELFSRRAAFSISAVFSEIWYAAQSVPQATDPSLAYILGMQYLNRNDRDMAYEKLSQAHDGDKSSFEYALALARVLSTRDEWDTMAEVLEPFSRQGRRNFELSVYLGRAFQNTGQYEKAVSHYLQAISYRGFVVNVLNSLGECYLETGNTERALWAWEKSLELRPGQNDLKMKVDRLKK